MLFLGMIDLHEAWALGHGFEPENTTEGKRIDLMWGTPLVRQAMTSFSLSSVFATHKTLTVKLAFGAFRQQMNQRLPPRALPLPTHPVELPDGDIWTILAHRADEWNLHVDRLRLSTDFFSSRLLCLCVCVFYLPAFLRGPFRRETSRKPCHVCLLCENVTKQWVVHKRNTRPHIHTQHQTQWQES